MTTPILLVEDDPSAQDLIRALCESRGHAIDVAADGFLGLRLLSERRHAIVLIDYHLPEMDGYALARLMREIAGSDARLRLVGITADAHGLASRRGADALFDAILAKPIVPDLLFATLDRLSAPEPAPERAPIETPADSLWRRRGLPRRPRAILCPGAAPAEVAAIAQAFDLVPDDEPCDLVLVAAEAGLDHLRSLRAGGPARLVPTVDLTGRLAAACDLAFAVTDAASWSALAEACTGFARRRADLSPEAAAAKDAAGRLAALLHVADRDLVLPHAAARGYETGHDPGERMASILLLMQAGFLTCEPVAAGLLARLTEAGRCSLAGTSDPDAPRPGAGVATDLAASATAAQAAPDPAPGKAKSPAATAAALVANERTMADLRGLIGDQTVARLHERLIEQAACAFSPDASLDALAHDAHVLISMSGTLGFERLAQACRSLQTAITQGRPVTEALASAKAARVEMAAWSPLPASRPGRDPSPGAVSRNAS